MASTTSHHTVGPLALRLHVLPHHLIALARKGLIPYARVGRYHIFAEADIPAIRAACVAAGYLRAEETAGAA